MVADGRRDPLLARNPVVRDGTVRSCVGVRLGTTEGRAIGTLLALDHRPRRWTTRQLVLLGELAVAIVSEVELEDAVCRVPIRDASRRRVPAAPDVGRE